MTHSRSWQALATIRSLGRRGIEVIAGDEYRVTPGSLSRFTVASFVYPSPLEHPEDFLSALRETIVEYCPGDAEIPYVLMPVHQETYLIAKHRERFQDLIRVPLAEPGKFEILQHKGKLAAFAEKLGLAVPRTFTLPDREALRRAAAQLQFPAFLKLPAAASGIGVIKVEDAKDAEFRFEELAQQWHFSRDSCPILQEAVPGKDYCASALYDHGRRIAGLSYHNIASFPPEHGPGVIRETVMSPKLDLAVDRLLTAIGWHGIAEVDFRWDGSPTGTPWLLEVNPRFFGGLFQAIESGVDYPILLFRLAAGQTVQPPDRIDLDTRTETPVLGLLATIGEAADSESTLDSLREVLTRAKQDFSTGSGVTATLTMLQGLKETLDLGGRFTRVKQLLEDNAHNVSVLFQDDDPLPVLGLLYPLAVFLRHGSLSAEVLTSSVAEPEPAAQP